MKHRYFILVSFSLLLTLGFAPFAFAVDGGDDPEITLTLLGTTENSQAVKIDYSIPYPGYVEFSLFQQENPETKIWYKAQVRQKGEHSLNIKRDALKPGVNYLFKFGYKGKMIEGRFNVG